MGRKNAVLIRIHIDQGQQTNMFQGDIIDGCYMSWH